MRLLMALIALVGLSQPAAAVEAQLTTLDEAAVQSTIKGQMDAFHRDDALAAFAYASPGIQRQFGDPEHFLAIVRRAYQPVYAPRSVDFTALSTEDGAVMQSVELIGPDGLAYTALYTMEHEPDGSWRIAACVLLESKRTGA